jgi:hypothetical protein
MERLFQATLSARWEGDASREAGGRLNVASSYDLWWTDNDPQQPALMPSVVRLSAECRPSSTTFGRLISVSVNNRILVTVSTSLMRADHPW